MVWGTVRHVNNSPTEGHGGQNPASKINDLLPRIDATLLLHLLPSVRAAGQDHSQEEQQTSPLISKSASGLIMQ